jgi:hypothetical protein
MPTRKSSSPSPGGKLPNPEPRKLKAEHGELQVVHDAVQREPDPARLAPPAGEPEPSFSMSVLNEAVRRMWLRGTYHPGRERRLIEGLYGYEGDRPESGENNIPKRAQIAAQQYMLAAEALGEADPTDHDVYDQLERAHKQAGEAEDLPSFATWQRNLREYRRLTGTQKHRCRADRTDEAQRFPGIDDIEPQSLPESVCLKRAD